MVTRGLHCAALLCMAVILCGGCRDKMKRITVRGGPSLDSLFSELADVYEREHSDVRITLNFSCPPCKLFEGQGEGPELDVFASIGSFEADRLREQGSLDLTYTTEVGRTSLSLVTSARTKIHLRNLIDLHSADIRGVGVGHPDRVSVGHYAKEALNKAGLWAELEDRFVYAHSGCELLKWLALERDIDAAIVFSVCRDEEGASLRTVQELPAELIPPVPLILGVARNAQQPEEARRFIDFVGSARASDILTKHNVEPLPNDD